MSLNMVMVPFFSMLIIRKINNLQYRPVQVNCAKGALSDSDLLSAYPSELGTAQFLYDFLQISENHDFKSIFDI
jgi:hypothetical protein